MRSHHQAVLVVGVSFFFCGQSAICEAADVQLELRETLLGHGDVISAVRFSHRGHILATASVGGYVILWDVRRLRQLQTIRLKPCLPLLVAFSPDDLELAIGNDEDGGSRIQFWEVNRPNRRAKWILGKVPVFATCYLPDGKLLAVPDDGRKVTLRSTTTGKVIRVFQDGAETIYSIAVSTDGAQLAAAGSGGIVTRWDVKTGKSEGQLKGHQGVVSSVVYSPEGRLIATAGEDKQVRIWDSKTGQLKSKFKDHTGQVSTVEFSSDGELLASCGSDKIVRLWNIKSGKLVLQIPAHDDAVTRLAFSPDGKLLATGSADETIKIWNVRRRKISE